jgi:hypothetical protein
MPRLRGFECIQNVLGVSCRSRVPATVTLKFINDLALTRKVPLAIPNIPLDMCEVV